MDPVARRYAEALFLAAKDADAVDAVAGDLDQIHQLVADPQLSHALMDAAVPQSALRAAVEKLVEGRHALTGNFLRLLVSKGRTSALQHIWPAYRAQLLASRGEADGVVESARPLEDAEVARLGELASQLSGQKVHLQQRVDEALLAGVRLRVGNTLYDASARSALEQLEKALMGAPLPE